jgi:hypothetical protein
MKRKARTWKVWIWENDSCSVIAGFAKPTWQGYWMASHDDDFGFCERGTKLLLYFLGFSEIPPGDEAWLVEVTAPGRSRIVKRMRGGA